MLYSPLRVAGLLTVCGLFVGGAHAEVERTKAQPLDPVLPREIFRVPDLADGLRRFHGLLGRSNAEAANAVLEQLITRFPDFGPLRDAQAELSEGKTDAGALQARLPLATPVRTDCPTAAEPPVPATPAWDNIEPALVTENTALVATRNTTWSPAVQRLLSAFVFPPILSRKPISSRGGEPARGALPAPELRQLQDWFVRGRAAGLAGTIYDNRDRGHSSLSPTAWPQLAFTEYSEAARDAGLDRGLNSDILLSAVTFGNSSTAVTGGPLWRSQARLALTTPEGPQRLFQLYAHDHLYVFPEHRDHDPAEAGGRGDLFPANTPYYLVSQGSSGSDRPFLVAVGAILAAMKRDVREFLDRHDLVAPTVQMVFRRGLAGVDGPEDYMGPRAHASAFRAQDIDLARMIRIAQALEIGTLPPMPCIRVQSQTHPIPRVGYFADGFSEILFDTPSAIARVWRGSDPERRYLVSASETEDPNGRELAFHWRLLRGDPERVRIRRLDEAGTEVEITVGWHNGHIEVPGRPELSSNRVDIAVFADNGATLSAPAFLSVLFPGDQLREYETLSDGTRRVLTIDYADPGQQKRYVDPALFPRREWRDSYDYDAASRLIGWTREQKGKPAESFTRHGLRVLSRDALGRPEKAEEMAYPIERNEQGLIDVMPAPTGRTYGYVYASEDDRLGAPTLEETAAE